MNTKTLKYIALLLILAGNFSSCEMKEDIIEDEDFPIYVWPEGPKYYYSFENKIFLDEVLNKVIISFRKEYFSDIQAVLEKNTQVLQIESQIDNNCCILTIAENSNKKAIMENFKKLTGVKSVNPMYAVSGGLEMGITNEFVVQFKETASQHKIDEIRKKYHVEIERTTELFQVFSVPIYFNTLEVANVYQESGLVNFSHPNFIIEISLF